MSALPRGIWFEPAKKRYRVRLYRNRIPFLVGYYYDLNEAEAALEDLRTKLAATPKRRRKPHVRPPPCATFRGLAVSIAQDQLDDPTLFRKPKP